MPADTDDAAQQPTAAEQEAARNHDRARDAVRVHHRAHLLPEEESAGSDVPAAQAEVILDDSLERTDGSEAPEGPGEVALDDTLERTDGPEPAPDTVVEHRTSEQAG